MAWNVTPPVWHFISQSSPASTASSDVFATMRAQMDASGVYWETVETPNTGTNSILFRAVTTQAIPFYSSSGDVVSTTILTASELYVLFANNITGSTAYRTPDNNTSAAARFQVGFNIGSASFLGANRDRPFLNLSGNLWSGYWVAGTLSILSQTFFLESEDILAIGFRETAGNYVALCGAIIEGVHNDAYRYYGMMTCGSTAITSNMWALSAGVFGHSTSANANHFGVFDQKRGAIQMTGTIGSVGIDNTPAKAVFEFLSRNTNSTVATNFVTGTTRIFEPVKYYYNSGSNEMIGYLRGIYITGDAVSLSTVFDSTGRDVAKILSNSRVAVADAAAFLPLSGSVVSYGPPYFAA